MKALIIALATLGISSAWAANDIEAEDLLDARDLTVEMNDEELEAFDEHEFEEGTIDEEADLVRPRVACFAQRRGRRGRAEVFRAVGHRPILVQSQAMMQCRRAIRRPGRGVRPRPAPIVRGCQPMGCQRIGRVIRPF